MTRVLALLSALALIGCSPAPAVGEDGAVSGPRSNRDAEPSLAVRGVEGAAQRAPSVCPREPTETTFAGVTACAGIDAIHTIGDLDHYAIGQAFGDYDADGLPDLYVTDTDGPNTLYHNRGDGRFARSAYVTDVALPDAESAGAIFADFDNDGWRDLYVVNRGPNVLFRNVEGRGFVDVTESAGVGDPHQGSSASIADYDGDGLLDLYVANWLEYNDTNGVSSRDVLYHNEGDWTFRDVTHLLGADLVSGAGFVGHFFDFDGDRDPDLYVTNDKGSPDPRKTGFMNRNVFFRNDGPGCDGWCFREVAVELGADLHINAMGIASADYDGDGDLDVYVTNSPREMVLLRNDGTGFVDVVEEAGVNIGDDMGQLSNAWGVVFLDYDNDGWLDLHVAAEGRNRLFHNLGDGRFAEQGERAGLANTGLGFGLAAADYDRDGRVDVLLGNRGDGYYLYRNVGAAEGGWIRLVLEGAGRVNRDAIGSRVVVHTSGGRALVREVDGGSSFASGNDTSLHIGLGHEDIESIEVLWPDGETTVIATPPSSEELRIRHPG